MKKRIFAIALICFMLVTMLPTGGLHVHADATQGTESANWHDNFDHTIEQYNKLVEEGKVEAIQEGKEHADSIAPSLCGKPGAYLYKCPDETCTTMIMGGIFVEPGKHDFEHLISHAEKPASCKDEKIGTKAYFECPTCGDKFVEGEGFDAETNKVYDAVTDAQLEIMFEHKWDGVCGDEENGNKLYCTNEGCKAFKVAKGHTYNPIPVVSTPDGVNGTATFACEVCEHKKTVSVYANDEHRNNDKVYKPAKKDATCTLDGIKDGVYYCATCKKYYADEYGMVELTYDQVKIEPLGHLIKEGSTLLGVAGKEPKKETCEATGYYWAVCERCNQTDTAACTKHNAKCTVCGKLDNDACLEHDAVVHYKHTNGKVYVKVIVPALNHIYGPTRHEPSCDGAGWWISACTVCGAPELNEDGSEKTLGVIPAQGHVTWEELENYVPFGKNITAGAALTFINPWTSDGSVVAGQGKENPYIVFKIDNIAENLKLEIKGAWLDTDQDGVADAVEVLPVLETERVDLTLTSADTEGDKFVQIIIYRGERLTVNCSTVDGTELTNAHFFDFTPDGKDALSNKMATDYQEYLKKTAPQIQSGNKTWSCGKKEPTCTQDGLYVWKCPCCTEYQYYVPEALGHEKSEAVTVKATCTTDGYTYTYCTRKGCDGEKQNYIWVIKNADGTYKSVSVTEPTTVPTNCTKDKLYVTSDVTKTVHEGSALIYPGSNSAWTWYYTEGQNMAKGEAIPGLSYSVLPNDAEALHIRSVTIEKHGETKHDITEIFVEKPTCEKETTWINVCRTCGWACDKDGKPVKDGTYPMYKRPSDIPHTYRVHDATTCEGTIATDGKCDLCEQAEGGENHTGDTKKHTFIDGKFCATCYGADSTATLVDIDNDGVEEGLIQVTTWACGEQDAIAVGICAICGKANDNYVIREAGEDHQWKADGTSGYDCVNGKWTGYICSVEDCKGNEDGDGPATKKEASSDFKFEIDKQYDNLEAAILEHPNLNPDLSKNNVETYLEPGCTNRGAYGVLCPDCGHRVFVYGPKNDGHHFLGAPDGNGGKYTQDKDDTATVCYTYVQATTATCMMPGNTAGGYCVVCHKNIKPTLAKALGHQVDLDGDGEADGRYTVADLIAMPQYAGKAPTCFEAGHTPGGWTCMDKNCDGYMEVTKATAGTVAGCEYGCKTGDTPTICDYHKNYPRLYSDPKKVSTYEVSTSKTEYGFDADNYVAQVEILALGHAIETLNIDKVHCATCGRLKDDDIHTEGNEAYDHAWVQREFAYEVDCELDGYTLCYCKNEGCEFADGVVIDYKKALGHDWQGATCVYGDYCSRDNCQYHKRTIYGYTDSVAIAKGSAGAALGHTNSKDHVNDTVAGTTADAWWFPSECGAFKAFQETASADFNYHCERCCADATTGENAKPAQVVALNTTASGTVKDTLLSDKTTTVYEPLLAHRRGEGFDSFPSVQGDCQVPQTTVYTCGVCQTSIAKKEGNWDYEAHHNYETTPKHNSVETYTYAYQVVEKCTICRKIKSETEVKEGVQFLLTVDNANAPGAGYTDSSLVKVTVSLASAAKVSLHSIAASLCFSNNVHFVEELTKFVNDSFTFNTVSGSDKHWINIVASAHDGSGNPIDVTIDKETALVELYFRVDANDTAYGQDHTYEKANFGFIMNFMADNTAKYFDSSLYMMALNAAGEQVNCAGDKAKINIRRFMDANENDQINLEDMLIAVEILQGLKDYDVVLDIDQDGDVGIDDVMWLYDHVVGAIDRAEVWYKGVNDAWCNQAEEDDDVALCPCNEQLIEWLRENGYIHTVM